MTRQTAEAIWGEEAVREALGAPSPSPVTAELLRQIKRRRDPPGAFRAWALSLPWPDFCAVVRVVAGVTADDLLQEEDNDHDAS